MSYKVRPLAERDLDRVQAIATASPGAPIWRRPDYALFLTDGPQAGPHLRRAALVAGAGSAPVLGFGCATLLLDGQENRAELETLAVDPAARRQGIGAALLQAVLDWATSEGARRVSLEVRASNAAALGLYERFGFRMEGRRRSYYSAPEEDALLLARVVTRG